MARYGFDEQVAIGVIGRDQGGQLNGVATYGVTLTLRTRRQA